jgi:uncharacterized protein YkwD
VPSRNRICAVLFALSLTLFATNSAQAAVASAREAAIVERINDVRGAHQLPPLGINGKLTRAARAHSRMMLEQDVFTHGAFDVRLRSFGVRFPLIAENIAWGTGSLGSPRAIVAAWMNSPPHRANLLHPRFRAIGIGTPVGNFGGYSGAAVVTADFGG